MTPGDLEAHRAAALREFARAHGNLLALFGGEMDRWGEGVREFRTAHGAYQRARDAHETALTGGER